MISYTLPTLVAIAMFAVTAQAADPAKGKVLVDQHCSSCHGTAPYTNQTRTITSLPGLVERVQMCAKANGLQWGETELADVTTYLNENFYHFGKGTP